MEKTLANLIPAISIEYGDALDFAASKASKAADGINIVLNTELVQKAFKWLVPPQAERIQVTPDNIMDVAAMGLPLMVLCYLVRRPGTVTIRRAIMPFAAAIMTKALFGYRWAPADEPTANFQLTLMGFCAIFRCIEFGWVRGGRRKMDEVAPGVPQDPKQALKLQQEGAIRKTIRGVLDAQELSFNCRGLGYDFGTGNGLKLPPIVKLEHNRFAWIIETLKDIAWRYVYIDMMHSFVMLQPWVKGVNTPAGGSIWNDDLPIVQKYLLGSMFHYCVGECLTHIFSLVYDIGSVLGVGVLWMHPSEWPPLYGTPWKSKSLHEYWSVHWHQMLRQTFLVHLGYPLQMVFGTLGLMVGVFLSSGLLHSWALWGAGGRPDNLVVEFFMLQFVGMIAERLWRKITGRQVGGRLGNLWMTAMIFIGGQRCSDAWAKNGILGGTIIPAQYSVVRNVLIPRALKIANQFGIPMPI